MGLMQPSEGRGLLGDRLSSCLIFEVCYRPESATHFQSSVDPSEVDARTRRRSFLTAGCGTAARPS